MPRTLPAQLTAALDSGSFKVYVCIGIGQRPSTHTHHHDPILQVQRTES